MPVLISFSGLPGVGKTTIAKALAADIGAVYIRVDEIEAALKRSVLQIDTPEDAGYLAASAIARSNLEIGHSVVADTVNPVGASRQLWSLSAERGGARMFDVEIICSDTSEHRRRVETREGDIDGFPLPNWAAVQDRKYEAWKSVDLRIDTSVLSPQRAVETIVGTLNLNQSSDEDRPD